MVAQWGWHWAGQKAVLMAAPRENNLVAGKVASLAETLAPRRADQMAAVKVVHLESWKADRWVVPKVPWLVALKAGSRAVQKVECLVYA